MGRAYDTLDDVDTKAATTIADVYALVLGEAMRADDLCGVVVTGALNLSHAPAGYWGRYPLDFKNHPEVWYVRCAPKGRIGKPLQPNEVRQVSVLVRESKTGKSATVTHVKLWRRPSTDRLYDPALDMRQSARGLTTFGPVGVSAIGINLFERRASASTTFATTANTHTVLPQLASITKGDARGIVYRLEAAMTPHYVLGSALLGLEFPDTPAHRNCEQSYTENEWSAESKRNAIILQRLCKTKGIVDDHETYLQLLFTAEDACEQMSFVGYLDQRADPFYEGALPDDMHKPSGMPLMVAVAVCIACNPERWGMPTTSADDALATKEAALFVEALLPGILPAGSDGTAGGIYSYTVVINYALTRINANIAKLQSGQLDGKRGGVDHRRVEMAMKASLNYLLCMGTAICVNLFGLRPLRPDGTIEFYGLASQLNDPVMAARAVSAYSQGLGNIVERWPTLRTSTQGRRQRALARVMVEVDEWLKTGRYRGVVLHPTTEASVSVRPEELDPAAPPAPTPPTPATTSARSSKKKKRPEALLAERGKQRDAKQSLCAREAVRCMFKNGGKDDRASLAASDKLCGEALEAASGIFSDILQGMGRGACVGMADLFDVTAYLVSPSSSVQCAHCENQVNVVQSVAFSGHFGACISCRHPRCLECVSNDIGATPDAEGAPNPRRLVNCLRCCTGDE